MPTIPELEQMLRERLDAFPRPVRVEMLRVLRLPDFDRASAIGEWWSLPRYRSFADLLIDAEEDKATRAVLVGMLAESLSVGNGEAPGSSTGGPMNGPRLPGRGSRLHSNLLGHAELRSRKRPADVGTSDRALPRPRFAVPGVTWLCMVSIAPSLPWTLQPMLSTLAPLPEGDAWSFEPRWDGVPGTLLHHR
jgi:hypothetical protein